jgi:anti-sigma-K factor RskA
MNQSPEDVASRYVLDQLDHDERAAFEAQLLHDSSLATLVAKVAAALDIRRSLLGFDRTLNNSTS